MPELSKMQWAWDHESTHNILLWICPGLLQGQAPIPLCPSDSRWRRKGKTEYSKYFMGNGWASAREVEELSTHTRTLGILLTRKAKLWRLGLGSVFLPSPSLAFQEPHLRSLGYLGMDDGPQFIINIPVPTLSETNQNKNHCACIDPLALAPQIKLSLPRNEMTFKVSFNPSHSVSLWRKHAWLP